MGGGILQKHTGSLQYLDEFVKSEIKNVYKIAVQDLKSLLNLITTSI